MYSEVCSPTMTHPPMTHPTMTHPITPGEDTTELMMSDEIVEEWSESDNDDVDDDTGDESIMKELEVFSRLEGTRSTLEDVMGMEKLMEAYTLIQVGGGWV